MDDDKRKEYGMRKSDFFRCVLCGMDVYKNVLCSRCNQEERDRQKQEHGSITGKQYLYIEHLISGMDNEKFRNATSKFQWDGDIEGLSTNEAGKLIAILANFTSEIVV